MVPTSYNGSQMIYYKVIRPFILRWESKIDKVVDQASDTLKEGAY